MPRRLRTMETQSGGSTQGNQGVIMGLEANIYSHGFLVGRGKASRINKGGLLLCFQEQLSVSTRHAYLEVELSLPTEIGIETYRVPVYVDSVKGTEFKLSFVDYGQEGLKHLKDHIGAIEAGLHAQVA